MSSFANAWAHSDLRSPIVRGREAAARLNDHALATRCQARPTGLPSLAALGTLQSRMASVHARALANVCWREGGGARAACKQLRRARGFATLTFGSRGISTLYCIADRVSVWSVRSGVLYIIYTNT